MSNIPVRVLRLLKKHPRYVLQRAASEARAEVDRFLWPRRAQAFGTGALLARTQESSIGSLWQRLADQPWPISTAAIDPARLEAVLPGSTRVVLDRAAKACRHEVDLLGSGPTALGERIPWHRDFKTGDEWPTRYFRDIRIVDQTRPSDVKIPWELSRLQWLLPVGQAYLLTQSEHYATATREVLEQWIGANPVAQTVNWAIAMEPAMRIFTWTWLFRVFCRSKSWDDAAFRTRFLCSLYQHAAFVERFLERADRNGNHFTADCAGLVVAGSFFCGRESNKWLLEGLMELEREVRLQFLDDGVNVEASSAYHRLVGELCLIAAMHAEQRGLEVSSHYKARLAMAARFAAAYTKPDGTAPLWGDADDGRVLPFGSAPVNDHRHLISCIAAYLRDDALASLTDGGQEELFWLLGVETSSAQRPPPQPSASYSEAGVYILRSELGYAFVDCGPVGFWGRGGHGHNDSLSFEAALDGVNVVEESGSYVYTASFQERNFFRSTAAHNTPAVDGEEINRFVDPGLLWSLHDDARPIEARITQQEDEVVFQGAHGGYRRLPDPLVPVRRIALSRDGTSLSIVDSFEGNGQHTIRVPLQLARGWTIQQLLESTAICRHVSGRSLRIAWAGSSSWTVSQGQGRIAPSYGVTIPVSRLEWTAADTPQALRLTVRLQISS